MPGYYADKLSTQRLKRCYELAPPRVRQYLEAEIRFVLDRIKPSDAVLELGCGYGRVLERLTGAAETVVGIDTSLASLRLAGNLLKGPRPCHLLAANAAALGFADGVFDVVVCIQNGISAFGVHPLALIRESVRVTGPGGVILLSSYSERFWDHRLEWFELQAAEGLLGTIDHERTGNGLIVCEDGFRATTVTPGEFRTLAGSVGIEPVITEVDGSSLFCELRRPSP